MEDQGMTGRDMIIYIMKHHLENDELFFNEDQLAVLLKLETLQEAAERFGESIETVKAWCILGRVKSIEINGVIYISRDSVDPRTEDSWR